MLLEVLAGFCVGVLARYVIPDSIGIGADTLLGIVGGGVGAFIYKLFGHRPAFDEWDAGSIACAVAGAFILILIVRAASGRRTIA
jgi:uncharacterized membrane protein YeaQ/YmgE (transglycosylase-associated protein family)